VATAQAAQQNASQAPKPSPLCAYIPTVKDRVLVYKEEREALVVSRACDELSTGIVTYFLTLIMNNEIYYLNNR